MDFHTFPNSDIPQAYGPYSHAVVAGDFVFIAGQTARDSQTHKLIEGDITVQTQRALAILLDILRNLDLSSRHVVRTTAYLANINSFAEMNAVYGTVFPAPHPARSTFEVKLPFGALVAFDAVAFREAVTAARS